MEFIDSQSMLRHAMGDVSLSELARRTGIGRSTLSFYTSGYTVPKPRHLRKIEKALWCKLGARWFYRTDTFSGVDIFRGIAKKFQKGLDK